MNNIKTTQKQLQCGSKVLDLSKPAVMGVLNLTPDSFSDGGNVFSKAQVDPNKVLATVSTMIDDGADIIDLGGESTRPGAEPVSVQEELDRVIPVLNRLTANFDSIFSIDTSTPEVMKEAADAGAHIINDVRALQRPRALQTAANLGLPVCLMHMQNQPKTMQDNPEYQDVLAEVLEFLGKRKQECLDLGMQADQILLDPGFGFGKTLAHNLSLFNGLPTMAKQDHPILVGLSRKSMIGQILDAEVNDRLIGSVTMALLAAQAIYGADGSAILRVHDVKETKQALDIWQAIEK
ncbi:MAG: dihydropteroate synthase [Porticoccaceae bacterium]